MTVAGVSADCPTELLSAAELRDADSHATPKPFWQRLSPTLVVCIVATTISAVTLGMLGLDSGVTGDPSSEWLGAAGGFLGCSFMATLAAGLRDFADQRGKETEQRARALVQFETFRIEKGQAEIREQVAYLRSEMFALISALPEGIVRYGDARDDEGEGRAVRRLTAAAEGASGRATVHNLRSVDKVR